jgi:cytochrome oxidase Cu insertion factor (SCO1/SenC/PrrC family)
VNEPRSYRAASKRQMRLIYGLLAGVAIGAVVLAQATGPARAELDALGPQVGQLAPDFTLPDQHGQPHRLSSLLGPKGALLVFFRSADW